MPDFPDDYGEEHPDTVADDLEALAYNTEGVLDFEVRRLLNHAVEIIRWATDQ